MHGFTACRVSFRHGFVDLVFSYCQKLNKSLYCRSQGVKLFGLHKCHRLNYINTTLPLVLMCTNLRMWKYFAVFLMWACILLSVNSYNKSQANPQLCSKPQSPTALQIFTVLGCQRDSCLCFTCCLDQ